MFNLGLMQVWRSGAWLVIAGLLAGCIYTNTTLPLAWVSNTRLDVQDLTLEAQEISGRSTAYILLFGLFSWGNAGLEAALRDARQNTTSEIKEVYDVKTDQKVFNILGLYMSRTIIVNAKIAR